jgi:hypothetical protein
MPASLPTLFPHRLLGTDQQPSAFPNYKGQILKMLANPTILPRRTDYGVL